MLTIMLHEDACQ